jgi:hypothetical protein
MGQLGWEFDGDIMYSPSKRDFVFTDDLTKLKLYNE